MDVVLRLNGGYHDEGFCFLMTGIIHLLIWKGQGFSNSGTHGIKSSVVS